jgi:hypothetical protein
MPLFRKKPVVIEAEQFDDAFVVKHYGTAHWPVGVRFLDNDHAEIPTLEGIMLARRGDWIITGVRGEKYPCKPDIFAATYEPVESSTGATSTEGEAPPCEGLCPDDCKACLPNGSRRASRATTSTTEGDQHG